MIYFTFFFLFASGFLTLWTGVMTFLGTIGAAEIGDSEGGINYLLQGGVLTSALGTLTYFLYNVHMQGLGG